ncbi:MAG: hypothetical protein ACE5H9_15000 [Anaerolineae bacterium]
MFLIRLSFIGAAIAALSLLASNAAFAHGGRKVGPYELNVGFLVEPAYEGLMNGVELRVDNEETGQPVEGLQETLQVEVTHIASGFSKTMDLEPSVGKPGHYTAGLIPTAPGEYRFRFFGTIEGTEIDEVFEPGPDNYALVESSKGLQIPEQLLEMREVGSAVRGAIDMAEQAQDSAATANILGIAGVVLGAIGTATGLGAVVMARRRG